MTAKPFPVLRSARYATGAASAERLPPPSLPEIAFAGRSNVGKSSLLNALVGRRGLARVSHTPGRTQLIHFFALNEALHFVDLPGYGYAAVSKAARAEWKHLVESYLMGPDAGGRRGLGGALTADEYRQVQRSGYVSVRSASGPSARASLKAVVLLCDVRREPGEEERAFADWLVSAGVHVIVVATKCDKVPKSALRARLLALRSALGEGTPMPLATAATAGLGLDELWRAIAHELPEAAREALR